MRKYNIANYVRYKKDVEIKLDKVRKPVDGDYTFLTDEEIQINFLPLVETLARKQSTSDQASGVLSINDLLQEGALGLCAAVTKLDRELLAKSDDQEKTLKKLMIRHSNQSKCIFIVKISILQLNFNLKLLTFCCLHISNIRKD